MVRVSVSRLPQVNFIINTRPQFGRNGTTVWIQVECRSRSSIWGFNFPFSSLHLPGPIGLRLTVRHCLGTTSDRILLTCPFFFQFFAFNVPTVNTLSFMPPWSVVPAGTSGGWHSSSMFHPTAVLVQFSDVVGFEDGIRIYRTIFSTVRIATLRASL